MTYIKKKTDDDSVERKNRRHATLERKRGLEPRYDPDGMVTEDEPFFWGPY